MISTVDLGVSYSVFLTLWPYNRPCLSGHPYFCEHLHARWYIFYTLSVFRYTKVYNDFPKWFVDQNKICLCVSRHKFYSHSVLNFVYNLIQIEVVGTSFIVSHHSRWKKKFHYISVFVHKINLYLVVGIFYMIYPRFS